ncbi:MAG: MOSC domain-containing protein [Pseudomonadota bacterium]
MDVKLERILRYPVKGLPGESVETATLEARKPLPDDRRYALAYGSGPLRDAQLAGLNSDKRLGLLGLGYEAETSTLTLSRDGKKVARGQVDQPVGQSVMSQFFAAYLKDNPRGTPRFVEAPEVGFSDWDEHFLHLINLATVTDLERVARTTVDPRRFRANLWVSGPPAWGEMDWVGRRLQIGEVLLEVADKTERCAATSVNPDTAESDLNVPRTLRAGYGHLDMGIYVRVLAGGAIKAGDAVEVLPL